MHERTDGRVNGWTDGRMDGRAGGWMDRSHPPSRPGDFVAINCVQEDEEEDDEQE